MLATISLIATVIFPGTGHLLLRQYLKGCVLAGLFAASTDVFLIAAFLWPGGSRLGLILVSLLIMLAAWVYALVDVVLRLRTLRVHDFQKRKDDLLRAAQVAWLKDGAAEAERLLRAIIAMDECDVEAWVHLGKVLKSRGREEEARRSFRTALHLEGSRRWHWELKRELGLTDVRTADTEAS